MKTGWLLAAALVALFPAQGFSHGTGNVNDPYNDHGITDLEAMLQHMGFSSTIFQRNPNNYGENLAIGKDITLVNTAAPGEIPTAGFTHLGELPSGAHSFGGEALSVSDFTGVLNLPSRTVVKQYAPNEDPLGFTLNPLIDGFSGTATLTLYCQGTVVAQHTATWNFDKPKCSSCTTNSCEVEAKIDSVHLKFSLGGNSYVGGGNFLTFDNEALSNPGVLALKFAGAKGTYGSTVGMSGNAISTVTTGNTVATVVTSASTEDENRFEILYSYVNDPRPNPTNPIYKRITVEMTAGALKVTEATDDKTIIRQFSQPAANTWILEEAGLRRTTKTLVSENATTKIARRLIEEKNDTNVWKVVSSEEIEETKYTWGWATTRSTIDPDGSALSTTFEYYTFDPAPEAVNPITAMGRLKRETHPNGLVRTYEYPGTDPYDASFDTVDVVKEHFSGTLGGKETRTHKKFASGVFTTLEEVFVLGNLVSKKETIASASSRIEKVYPSATASPLVTEYTKTGDVIETTYPDGLMRKEIKSLANNELATTVYTGVKNSGSGHYLLRGDERVVVVNPAGTTLREIKKAVHGGVAYRIEERVTAQQDHLGRILRVDVFHGNATTASHSEYSSYSCCGLASETGRDGITSQHFYDALGRRRKSSRNGTSEETIRDALTVYSHRYPEALSGSGSGAAASNLLSSTTYNLAGDLVSSQERSPKDGAMIGTSVQTAYNLGSGVGKAVTRTYPQTSDDQGISPTITETYAIDGSLIARSGSLAVHESVAYSSNTVGIVETRSKLDGGGQPFEIDVHQQDWLGRELMITYPGNHQATFQYDATGRLVKTTDPDGVSTLASVDMVNGVSTTAIDVNANGTLDPAVDHLAIRKEGVGLDVNGKVIRWRESAARSTNGQGGSVEVTLSRTEITADELKQTTTTYGGAGQAAVSTSTTEFTGPGEWKVITMRPDTTFSIRFYKNGLLDRAEEYSTQGVLVSSLAYTYDSYRRVAGVADSRGPGTTYQYLAPLVDFVVQTTIGARVSVVAYDERGRAILNDEPDSLDDSGNTVTNARVTQYWPFGGIREETGTPGYHVSYTYDAAQRMATTTTYGTATAVTRWEYDPNRGWLVQKRYNSSSPGQGSGESYTYTPGGRLLMRTLARGVTSTYNYAASGALSGIVYSDSTPTVTIHERDQQGRVTRLTDGAGERILGYDGWGAPAAESYSSGGILGGWKVTQSRDALGRLSAIGTDLVAGGASHSIAYGYGNLGRVATVASGGTTATYRYNPTHQRVSQIDFSSGATPFLQGSMQYDAMLRPERITYHNGQTTGAFKLYSDFRYTRDAYGKITSAQRMDASKQLYGYNAAGEVVADRKLRDAAGNEFLRGQSFRWTYDGIGNRLTSAGGGDTNGQNLRATGYTSNALNQYATIQNPGTSDVIGVAQGQAAVTVNSVAATRQGDWFHGEVSGDNSSGPLWKATSVNDGTVTKTGSLIIPPATQTQQFDADGNLTSDGIYGYTWDAENRLIKIETHPAAVTAGIPYQRVEMAYDSQWRRIRRDRFSASSGSPVETTRYLWAGWRCLADLGTSNSFTKCYTWGLDQAHRLHLGDSNNALLWTHDLVRNERHFCHYDGNGNIAGLSDAAGNHSAEYFYNAFGLLAGKRGSYAGINLFRFSTKPFEEVGGLYYYGYRYYDPATGRWPSKDPIAERGGPNPYAFVGNSSINLVDLLGQQSFALSGPSGSTTYQNGQWVYKEQTYTGYGGPRPGAGDQWNPFGYRGSTGKKDYRGFFEWRFPKTVAGAKDLLETRIKEKVCAQASKSEFPESIPNLVDGKDDVDIKNPDMSRFGDFPQDFWEKNVDLGKFEIKAENVHIQWRRPLCCFEYTATVYIEEQTGADPPSAPGGEFFNLFDPLYFTPYFYESKRHVRMAEWQISGFHCCPK